MKTKTLESMAIRHIKRLEKAEKKELERLKRRAKKLQADMEYLKKLDAAHRANNLVPMSTAWIGKCVGSTESAIRSLERRGIEKIKIALRQKEITAEDVADAVQGFTRVTADGVHTAHQQINR